MAEWLGSGRADARETQSGLAAGLAEGEGFVSRAAPSSGSATAGDREEAARYMPGYPVLLAAADTTFGARDRAVPVLS